MSRNSPRTDAARKKTNSAIVTEQAAQAYELRLAGATLRQIGEQLGISIGTVHKRIATYMAERVDPLADQYRAVELDRLDDLTAKAYAVLTARHIVVQHGKVVRDENGEPIPDHAPILQAIGTLVRLAERRSKLLGLDAAVKVDAQVTTVDPADIELAQMIREAQAKAAAEEARLRGEATQ
jgi:hypothetical protein